MAAFSPGQSPPPVRTPTRIEAAPPLDPPHRPGGGRRVRVGRTLIPFPAPGPHAPGPRGAVARSGSRVTSRRVGPDGGSRERGTTRGAVEAGVTEGEHPAVGGHLPVPAAVHGGGQTDDRRV